MVTWAIAGWACLAGVFGIFVGLSELLNRYKSFYNIFINKFSIAYMLINFISALAAYLIIKVYGINFGELSKQEIGISLVAGFGAMVFLRSSFFSYKDSKDKVIEVGPALILSVFLKAAERQFDQMLSRENVKEISDVMDGVNFHAAAKDLPLIVLSSMRVLNDEEQKILSDEVLKLVNDPNATIDARNIALGLIMVKYTGIDLLKEIVANLKKNYDKTSKDTTDQITKVQKILRDFRLKLTP